MMDWFFRIFSSTPKAPGATELPGLEGHMGNLQRLVVRQGKDLRDLKTLVDKEFVSIENIGRIHRYHPLLTKEEYSKRTLTNVAKGYFEGSFSNVVSFLVDEKRLSIKDLELLLKQLKASPQPTPKERGM